MQEIYTLKMRSDKKEFDLGKIKNVHENFFKMDYQQLEINSPRINKIEYKSVYCLCYFLVNYIIANDLLEKQKV